MPKKIKWTKPLLRPVDGLKNVREGVSLSCNDGSSDATSCSMGNSFSGGDCTSYGSSYTPPVCPGYGSSYYCPMG
ncbi:MAG: hypothetical protein WCI77_00515 [Candidatus Omnitrophota bacterium]